MAFTMTANFVEIVADLPTSNHSSAGLSLMVIVKSCHGHKQKCDHVLVVGLGLVLVLICWSLALVLILWSSSKSVTFLILHSEAVDIQEVHIIANQIFLRLEHVIVKN